MPRNSIAAVVLLVIGLAVATYQIGARVLAERPGTIAVCLEFDEIQRILASDGANMRDVLTRLSPLISHVALPEQTWRDMQDLGLLSVASGPLVPQAYVPPDDVVVNLGTWAAAKQFQTAMQAEGIDARPIGEGRSSATPLGRSFVVPAALTHHPEIGVGYDAAKAAMITGAGLGVIARPVPVIPASPTTIRSSLQLAKNTGASIVIFSGNEVIGNPLAIPATKNALDTLGLRFGWIELSPQLGANSLASLLKGSVLRVHSISEPEMHHMTPETALDRYARAVRERGIRVLYVRLLPTSPDGNIVSANFAFLTELHKRLTDEGFALGDPQVVPDLHTHAWSRALMALGLVGLLLLALPYMGLAKYTEPKYTVPLAVVAAAMAAAGGLPLDVVAFAGIMLGATVGLLAVRPHGRRMQKPLLAAGAVLVAMSIVNILAATMAVAMMSDRLHMSGVVLFRGVKLSLFLPPLLVLIVQAARSTRTYGDYLTEGGEQSEAPALLAGLRDVGDNVVRYWHVVVIVLLLATTALMLIRSGNEAIVGKSHTEMKARTALADTLGLRPRSKEFAFGHPLLLLGLWLLYRGRKRGAWLALSLGSIGQASMANTFCHIHSPYRLAVERGLLGLVAGIVVGLVLIAVWYGVERLRSRSLQRL